MTYIPDGTSKDYGGRTDKNKSYSWGWLSSDHEYPTGWEDEDRKEDFIEKVESLEIVDRWVLSMNLRKNG